MQFQCQCQCQCQCQSCQHFMQQAENGRVFFPHFSPQMSQSQNPLPTNYGQQQQYGPNNNYAMYQQFYQYQYPFVHNSQQVFMATQQQQQFCYNQPNQCTVQPRWVQRISDLQDSFVIYVDIRETPDEYSHLIVFYFTGINFVIHVRQLSIQRA